MKNKRRFHNIILK